MNSCRNARKNGVMILQLKDLDVPVACYRDENPLLKIKVRRALENVSAQQQQKQPTVLCKKAQCWPTLDIMWKLACFLYL